jgi:hypothetical protein
MKACLTPASRTGRLCQTQKKEGKTVCKIASGGSIKGKTAGRLARGGITDQTVPKLQRHAA